MWVYAGGGEAEVAGFVPLLQRHFRCTFQRRTPRRKPGPRPDIKRYSGSTGKDLMKEIETDIQTYWDGTAEVILVMDDTDGRDAAITLATLRNTVSDSLVAMGLNTEELPIVVALAVPELEIWLIGDWRNTLQRELGACQGAVQHELSSQWGVDFANPENFKVFLDDGPYRKFNTILMDVIHHHWRTDTHYSKATDTPRLLLQANPTEVGRRCPHFRLFWNELAALCPLI